MLNCKDAVPKSTGPSAPDKPLPYPCCHQSHTRREFLIGTTCLALTAMMPACSGTTETIPAPPPQPAIAPLTDLELEASCAWIGRGEPKGGYHLYKKAVEGATDFSWLSHGDSVLVKLSLNTGKPYPATTDPWSLHCMIRLLREKGAGRIIVGDQSSFGTVQWTQDHKIGSSRRLARQAGLLKIIEEMHAVPCFFEELGWDAFFPAEPAGSHHWKSPIMVPSVLNEVDHIVFLPRVASHVLAGNSLGFKLAVGFLRSDSREAFHKGGPNFYAMYEEINRVPPIESKLRLTVSSGRSVLTLLGPNDGPTAEPDHGLVIASDHLLAHEMLAYAWLQWNRQHKTSTFSQMTYGKPTRNRSRYNRQFSDKMWPGANGPETPDIDYFEPGNLYDHPAVLNHLKRLGGRPRCIHIREINRQPDESVTKYLKNQINI